jgi:hypothetical protein
MLLLRMQKIIEVCASDAFRVSEVVEGDDIGIIKIDTDWDTGEGGFRWKGRSSRSAEPNKITVNWTQRNVYSYLAEFTNLNNTYYAHPVFDIEYLDASGNVLSRTCLNTAEVNDEDAGNEPTVYDYRDGMSRNFSTDVQTIRLFRRRVWWTYLVAPPGSCTI